MSDFVKYTEKANTLLKEGDALAKTNPAESRRLLRECRRYRKLARIALEVEKNSSSKSKS